jgi:hypothetical protein
MTRPAATVAGVAIQGLRSTTDVLSIKIVNSSTGLAPPIDASSGEAGARSAGLRRVLRFASARADAATIPVVYQRTDEQ